MDSGSEVTVIDEKHLPYSKPVSPSRFQLYGANGSKITVVGQTDLVFELGRSCKFKESVIVTRGITSGCILGADLLKKQGLVLDSSNNTLRRGSTNRKATARKTAQISRRSEKGIQIRTPFKDKEILFTSKHACFPPVITKTSESGFATILWQNPLEWNLQVEREREVGEVSLLNRLDLSMDVRWKSITTVHRTETPMSTDLKQELVKQVPLDHLGPQWKSQYQNLFSSFVDVFSLNPNDIGKCAVLPQTIVLKDPARICCTPPYRTPPHLQGVVNEYVDNLLAAGVIQKSTSPFCSPLLLVKKANASPDKPLVEQYRVVHDYRQVNDNCVRDSYPLHNLYDLIDKVAASKVWSVIDLSSGFWNQMLDPKSSPITAFGVPGKGHYEYLRSAQGLCNSPASFQRLLDHIVRDIPNVYVYIDDVVIASKDHKEHLDTLTRVFQRFRQYNLKCRPRKLQIATAEINYLGYNLSHENGIRPGLAKTETIKKWQPPESVKEIRQFLGLCSFFRRTIPKFAHVASPLTRLTRKDAAWNGGQLPPEALEAFHTLKALLIQRPCLRPPDFNLPFILTVDASTVGLGAILSQKHGGVEHPIAYASRTLTEAEKKNAPFHLEYMAMVWACRHFKPYLIGKRFTLRTDHKPLQSLNKVKGAAFQRCQMELEDYDFEVEYLSGEKMPADGLSRLQVNDISLTDLRKQINFSWSQVKETQKNDPEIKALAIYHLYGKKAAAEKLAEFIESNKSISKVEDGVVVAKNTGSAFAPRSLRQTLLNLAHDFPGSGHYSGEKTYVRLARYWYWPTMKTDVQHHCRSCPICIRTNVPPIPSFPLQKLPVADDFNTRIHLDLLGPLPDNSGAKYVLAVVDAYSKFLQVVPLENKSMDVVASAFFDSWISQFGTPKLIVSDQGKEFVNSCFQLLDRKLGITHKTTSPYHPMANGQAESSVREVLRYARKHVDGNNWVSTLASMRMAHNMAFNSTIKCTPYEAVFCRKPILAGDIVREQSKIRPNYLDSHVSAQIHHYTTLRHDVLKEAEASFEQWKKQFDQRAKRRIFIPGDKVFLKQPTTPGQYHKFQNKLQGPYLVIKENRGTLWLTPMDPQKKTKEIIAHSNNAVLANQLLQLYDSDIIEQDETAQEPQEPDHIENQGENMEFCDDVSPSFTTRKRLDPGGRDDNDVVSSSDDTTDEEPDLSSNTSSQQASDSTSESEEEDRQRTQLQLHPPAEEGRRITRSNKNAPLPDDIVSRYLPLRQKK